MRSVVLMMALAAALQAGMHEAEGDGYTFETAQQYCRNYQGGGWRTLQIKELFALRGDTRFSRGRAFWSGNAVLAGASKGSTGSEGDAVSEGSEHGYTFYLQDGDVTVSPAEKKAGVICTDAPPSTAQSPFKTTPEGVVDRGNGILWQHLDATDKKAKYTFEEAQHACENLELYGREWRLPDLDELYGIVTYARKNPSVDTEVFGVMMNRYYWSGESFNDKQAYVVGFKLGSVATSDKGNESYIRCVSDLE